MASAVPSWNFALRSRVDRKSTRLNFSHLVISYAVFCLKKKNPKTGDVLAVAIRPTFNPNTFAEAKKDEFRNRDVSGLSEPGSTFKIIMAAAALEEGVVKPEEQIFGEC